MKRKMLSGADNYLARIRRHRLWLKIVGALGCVVVFCTTYALILPAITMEKQEQILSCPFGVHQHTEECYDADNRLTCGQADYIIHMHNEDCKDKDGNLVCQLLERKAHEHTEECYQEQRILICGLDEQKGHIHEDFCYEKQKGELICDNTDETHEHTDDCYAWEDVTVCGEKEGQGGHQHSEECYQTESILVCGEQGLHTHTDDCYDENGKLACGLLQLEEHVHGDGCFKKIEAEEMEIEENETAKTEIEESEAEKIETVENEPEKAEIGESEVEKTETVEGEGEKTETVEGEVEKTETVEGEVEKTETVEGEVEKTETVEGEGEKTETVESEVEKIETVEGEVEKTETGEGEAKEDETEEIETKEAETEEIGTDIEQQKKSELEKETKKKAQVLSDEIESQSNEANAAGISVTNENVKFIATFPEGTTFYKKDDNKVTFSQEQLILKAEKYDKGENDEYRTSIDAHMKWHTGEENSTNDVQFWRVYLVNKDNQNEEVQVELPTGEKATMVVEYIGQDGDGALRGKLGTRKTCVMDMGTGNGVPSEFVNTDKYELALSHEINEISKEEEYYKKITYYISANEDGSSAWGHPTALCSMKLTPAYIQSLHITDIIDGYEPFDNPEADGSNVAGNDSSGGNKIVRSFDDVEYKLSFAAAPRRAENGNMDEFTAVVETELERDITEVRFDKASLKNIYKDWQIEYKNESGRILYIENESGLFRCDDNGEITNNSVSLNDIVNGSSDANPYRTNIASQHLVAYRTVTKTEGESAAVPGTHTTTIKLNVKAAQNNTEIKPKFSVYVKGNKANFTSEQDKDNQYVDSTISKANIVEVKPEEVVTVSAAARYNIVLKQNTDAGYVGYFDFENGKEGQESGTYGRISTYGITLQMFNETNVDGKLPEKGLKGMELPKGNISFDLTLEGAKGNSQSQEDFSAILWDYTENKTGSNKTGKWNRNTYWKNADVTLYAKGAAPYNSDGTGTATNNRCYNGGVWTLQASGNNIGSDGKTTAKITGGGNDVTYTFTVNGFDFDFDNWSFPTHAAGDGSAKDWLEPAYMASFSAGYIQVVQKYPANLDADACPEIKVTVGNMRAVSVEGTEITEEAEGLPKDQGGYGGTYDNQITFNTAVYTPGSLSKHNSFTARKTKDNKTSVGISSAFLGEDYWGGIHYDADTFAGSEIFLWGGTQLARKSDGVVSAYNLLQKFDSTVLSIDTSYKNGNDEAASVFYTDANRDGAWPSENWNNANLDKDTSGPLKPEAGKYIILYAADPKYPGGWDSNISEQMKRMNQATEKDLIYFETLDALEGAGYKCIAVLLEVREADIPAGCYPGLRIAMKVSDEPEHIGKTICTVNTARMWTKIAGDQTDLLGSIGEISWKNGSMNNLPINQAEEFTENTIVNANGERPYDDYWDGGSSTSSNTINSKLRTNYQCSTATYLRSTTYNNYDYVKTEYKDGQFVSGTHSGGYQAGMSLLIIGYEAQIGLKVENPQDTGTSGSVSFDTSKSQWNPLYTITEMRANPSDSTGTGGDENQTTNLVAKVAINHQADKNQLSIGMKTFKVKSLVEDKAEWITISEEENNPTQVTFKDADGKEYSYKIWAERTGDYRVAFHLEGAPIGVALPDIQFEGQLGVDVKHGDNYTAEVTIQGDGDKRALSNNNRNKATASITTVVLEGTSLIKQVNEPLIEQNGSISYSISYTNHADTTMDKK